MTSASSTRSESPADIDFSVIKTSIEMGHKMIDQILNGIHYGSDEVRNLLREECDFILECKVCRNLFRSFPNFVAHKRVYCMEYFEEKVLKADLVPVSVDEETVVIQPEAPEDAQMNDSVGNKNAAVSNSNVEKVINKTFEGKSKEYQFYTKVAEDVEKRKVTKVTNTVILTPIATTSKAVEVIHSKGDKSAETLQGSNAKKLSPVKNNDSDTTGSLGKKKNSVVSICADLTKKILQGEKKQVTTVDTSVRLSSRSRKSSPRKSIDYLDNSQSGDSKEFSNDEEDMEVSELSVDKNSDVGKEVNENSSDKEWMKFCDVKNSMCRICKKSFSSQYNLKFHAKMKHLRSVVPYTCPHCESSFDYFTSLARHLRRTHTKSESYINTIKMKLQRRKSTDSMETAQTDSSSDTSSASPSSPQKVSGMLLSYSTGWKKCDKCGKVCWKAKSFYRHYSTCKGQISKSATNAPIKSDKARNGNGGPKNSTALLKLQEKLRAGVIQPSANVDNSLKTKVKERHSSKDNNATETYENNYPELFKSLTNTPLTTDQSEENMAFSDKGKMYYLRDSKQNNEEEVILEETVSEIENKNVGDTDKNKEIPASSGSPAFKKLEERLVREAGLKEVPKPEKNTETVSKPYGTRNASQVKSSFVETNPSVEAKEIPLRARNISTDLNKDDNLSKVKEKMVLRESPEIKELEEKLTREALGHKKEQDEQNNKSGQISKDHMLGNNSSNEKNKSDQTIEETAGNGVTETELITVSRETVSVGTGMFTKRSVSRDAESRREKISERLREKMAVQESVTTETKLRSSRSESKEKVNKEGSFPDKTPEKMKLLTNLSPVGSPSRTSALPSSPTPSVQSSSGDGYNMKFKMTVQEMAELVESASLTKFAKERKKRARKILNTKQVKESQKVSGSLAKPMKRQVKKRNIVIRNVYGTRNKKDSDLNTKKEKTVYSTRSLTGLSYGEPDSTNVSSRTKTSPRIDCSVAADISAPSRDSLAERRAQMKRLSREQKRLLNSEGFVEKNVDALLSIRDSSKDKHTQDRPLRDTSKDRPSRDSSKDTPSRNSSKDTPSRDSSKNRPSRDSSKDGPSRDSSKNRPSRDSSKDTPSRDSSKDRPSRDSSKTRPSRDLSKDRPSRNSSKDRPSRDLSKDMQSSDSLGERLSSDSSGDTPSRNISGGQLSKDTHDSSTDKTSQVDIMAAERRLSGKRTGFVCPRGLQYESDSSVDRDTSSKVSQDVKTARVMSVKKISKPETANPQEIRETETSENMSKALNAEEKAVEDEKFKLSSSVKKTVLYVGKNFTEKIKSIQERKADVSQEVEPEKVEGSEAKICSTRNKLNLERQNEKSGKETKLSPKQNVSDKRDQSDLKESKQTTESPKHRTRLATGSIYFDSELLKLSPSKAEKKAAELSKTGDSNKGTFGKGNESESGLGLIKKRLSLSPKRDKSEKTKSQHQRTNSAPQKYSLSAGVKQCQKCNRRFWKKKAFVHHLTNSPCADKRIPKSGRKRALSFSPDGIKPTENQAESETANTAVGEKVKTIIAVSKEPVNENQIIKEQTGQDGSRNEDHCSKKRRVDVVGSSLEEKLSGFEKEYVKFTKRNDNRLQNEVKNSDMSIGIENSNVSSRKKTEDAGTAQKLLAEEKNFKEKEQDNSKRPLDQTSDKPGRQADDKLENTELSGIGQNKNLSVKSSSGDIPVTTKSQYVSSKNLLFLNETIDKKEHLSSVSGNDEVPGPSASTSSLSSGKSDGNESDFSGFSEDELRVGEEELSKMNLLEENLEG